MPKHKKDIKAKQRERQIKQQRSDKAQQKRNRIFHFPRTVQPGKKP